MKAATVPDLQWTRKSFAPMTGKIFVWQLIGGKFWCELSENEKK
jgi:hypothetical protein